MRTKGVIAGVTALAAAMVSYALVQGTSPSHPVHGAGDVERVMATMASTPSTVIVTPGGPSFWTALRSTPDSIKLLATGVALLGAAAGMRRRLS